MNKTEEKFNKFSYMVMKEADSKKKEIISQAEEESAGTISEKEILLLKKAYDQIHESLVRIEKKHNEEVSKAILESKQTLFNRREEILNSVFLDVREKLRVFKNKDEYKSFMTEIISQGLDLAGEGEILIYADIEDFSLVEDIRAKLREQYELSESEEQLLGGCLICNRTKGLMYDYSFINRLNNEKVAFLENYGLSID